MPYTGDLSTSMSTEGRRNGRLGPWQTLEFANDEISVTVLPEKGCDIIKLVDRETGVDVLVKTPWAYGRRPVHTPSSLEAWIEMYPGGWQLLLPNGGDAVVENGVEWGFHGEAGLIEWQVERADEVSAVCSTSLITAPLAVVRLLRLDHAVLQIEDRVTNLGGDPIEVMWGHHPAFGAPFLEPGCRIETSARTFTADDRTPGANLEPGQSSEWPYATLAGGGHIDLSVIPPYEEQRAVLGYLHDFERGAYRVVNPRQGLAVELRWPLDVFPTAWFWQELNASSGYPWYRRMYTTAVEPNTTAPAHGIAHARASGGATLLLEPNVSRTVTLEAEIIAVPPAP
jgi:Domain of unknown function (DUF4432)